MKRECLNCGKKEMVHTVRDVPYAYKRHNTVISKIKGWHCFNCGEVEFDAGEGVRFAEAIKQLAKEVDAKEAAELARIRKKLKLTQQQAALLTGGGPNAFSRYERGKAKPLQSVTNLFKLLDNHPDLLDEITI
ncbi:MAG: type II toxin-antitoxin system MqsA family antitoxin [Deltaproteobacteria bacterium]|uniref:type II toxin-antitoxin system MqsA family antitoxin n=1 Tax=Desulfobacula sp. TaxID=2593537 RepID=UPI0019BD5AF1|nr:type II toxin-antitoxin system MqsA family antitoxin [Candidatus Desulfobacula maris]MBL6992357.1 type II toxin-antitoxin system MqsA family antitoxin [Desulfobacula sp.]